MIDTLLITLGQVRSLINEGVSRLPTYDHDPKV